MKGNRAKGKSAEVRDINLALDNIKAQIIKHYLRIFDREAFVTAEMVSNAYQGIGSEYETLLKASGRENEVFKKRVGKDRVMATTVHGWWQETMWQRSSSLFTDGRICSCWRLSPTSSRGLQPTYQRKRDFTTGRIWEKCMWLKGVVMCVHFNGLIPKKTFAQFHISPNVTEREFLTEDELKTLMTHELGMSNCSIFVTFLFSPASLPSLSWTSRN